MRTGALAIMDRSRNLVEKQCGQLPNYFTSVRNWCLVSQFFEEIGYVFYCGIDNSLRNSQAFHQRISGFIHLTPVFFR
jgi:hypothetical protein